MIHLNGNKLCSIDCETTGLDPYKHDIWQICVLPLGFDLKPDKDHVPFDVELKPRNIENREPGAINKAKFNHLVLNGMDYEIAADLFMDWYEKLGLGFKKRIVPLAHNWPFDREFIIEWLGRPTFEYCLDPRYRDTMAIGAFLNDVCDNKAEMITFPSISLRRLASNLEVEWDTSMAHEAQYDSFKTAEVYRRLLTNTTYIGE